MRNIVHKKAVATVFAAWLFAGIARSDQAELWNKPLGSSFDSCAAIAPDGTSYVTGSGYLNFKDFSGGKLAAFAPSGAEKWVFKTVSDIKSSPALATDGTIYFGGRDRKLHAITSNGREKWSFAIKGWIDSSPAIGADGTIYFGGWDRNFYALNPDGGKKWEFAAKGVIDSSPAIAADGTIYFGSHDKKFYALNPDGSVKWTFATAGAIISSPALGCDGGIFITSVDGNLYALNADGTVKWRLWTGGVGASSPVLDAEGNICLGVNNTFWVITSAGVKKWSFGYPVVTGSAALAADGTIYFAGTDPDGVGHLYQATPTGMKVGEHYATLGTGASSSPAIAPDGTVYIGGWDGRFHALKGAAGPAGSCWPTFRGNMAGTGRANVPKAQ